MIRPDPDQLADRLENEIAGAAFVLLGPEDAALCVAALRFYTPWESKQPMSSESFEAFCKQKAAEQPTPRTPDTTRPVHPKLAEVLESYGAVGKVVE